MLYRSKAWSEFSNSCTTVDFAQEVPASPAAATFESACTDGRCVGIKSPREATYLMMSAQRPPGDFRRANMLRPYPFTISLCARPTQSTGFDVCSRAAAPTTDCLLIGTWVDGARGAAGVCSELHAQRVRPAKQSETRPAHSTSRRCMLPPCYLVDEKTFPVRSPASAVRRMEPHICRWYQ